MKATKLTTRTAMMMKILTFSRLVTNSCSQQHLQCIIFNCSV